MNNNNLSQATNNDVVCEAVGCYARANTKLLVRVGSQETIVSSTRITEPSFCDHISIVYHLSLLSLSLFCCIYNNK
jgi:hypothetical protein